MNRARSVAVAVLGCVLGASSWAAPAHAGGGGHGVAHAGGGHAAGAHVGGGGHASGGRMSGGVHFASAAHYSGSARGYRAAGRGYGGVARGYRGYASAYAGRAVHFNSTGAYWGGGYWRGGWWPRAYYGAGFAWFLPVLPLAYATYWYAGTPYYYANELYYTWNPDYKGYVATDPPPVADPSGAAAGPDAPRANAAPSAYAGAAQPPQDTATASPARMSSQGNRMFIYPSHGQSGEKQRTDKLECEKWGSDEVGLGSNGPDYQRALAACLEGRGYSVN